MNNILHGLAKSMLLALIIFGISFSLMAEDGHHTPDTTKKKFDAGKMIMEHIADAHEWHIATIGHTHISLPLPVILIDNGSFHVFMSSKFHHGLEAYKDFRLMTEGAYKGKIVKIETLADGTESISPDLPLDFSITKNVAAIFFSVFLMIWIFMSVAGAYKKNAGHAPKGMQSFLEPIIIFVRDDIAKSSIGEKNYEKYLPYLLTVFFFIFLNNLLGLVPFLPGGANVTGNIAVTLVLALFTFAITTFSGNKAYWLHIFNAPGVPWWLKLPIPLLPIVELLGIFTKPFVLMIRLFANMAAGHIIILAFMSLIFIFGNMHEGIGLAVSPISLAFSIFMGLLELLVAFLQAFVFTLLSAIYFGLATEEHH
ncbi:MAG: F0F1 ATP synthase subunit A [Bacteroidales bacterium]|jgi:F-type H+-transporting ATPase subunit a|nr:F0F1 ATP synthase subunit A [Bacteroidales bacterium]